MARLALPLALVLAASCSGDRSQPTVSYEVADRFETGRGIYVRALAVDGAENKLWVGTSMGVLEIGLESQALLNTFTRSDGLANEYVFAIGIDSAGYKWFGTNAGGVSRYRDGEWKTIFPMHGLADYWVYAFAQQAAGDFWIGTWDGANRVDPGTLEMSTYRKELVNEWVYGLAVDSADRVWFGTEGGVSRYDGEEWAHWTHADGVGAANDDGLPASHNTGLGTRTRHDLSVLNGGQETYNPGYVFAVHVDEDDVVRAGTWGGGVARFAGGEWRNLTAGDGLAGNIVYAIAADRRGGFWFGTNRGLSHYDGEDFVNFTTDDGLFGNDVYAIAVTADLDVWVGTHGGVVRLAPRTTGEDAG